MPELQLSHSRGQCHCHIFYEALVTFSHHSTNGCKSMTICIMLSLGKSNKKGTLCVLSMSLQISESNMVELNNLNN